MSAFRFVVVDSHDFDASACSVYRNHIIDTERKKSFFFARKLNGNQRKQFIRRRTKLKTNRHDRLDLSNTKVSIHHIGFLLLLLLHLTVSMLHSIRKFHSARVGNIECCLTSRRQEMLL